jgi:phosphoglycerate dehydrogenase-like enzyme
MADQVQMEMQAIDPRGIYVGPGAEREIEAAIRRGGGRLVPITGARAIVWLSTDPGSLGAIVPPSVEWVQLSSAGVERFVAAGVFRADRRYTSAGPAFATNVAEHALALMLACGRNLHHAFRARSWKPIEIRPLRRRTVLIIGCGRIGRALMDLLEPFDVTVYASTRSGASIPGADVSLKAGEEGSHLGLADFVVLAAPATEESRHLIGSVELDAMAPQAFLVNVSRGSLVDTDALVDALRGGKVAGAALDVTDPEPLPGDHPLWSEPTAIITPHIANTAGRKFIELAPFIEENVRRFLAGEQLLGLIDPSRGY